MRSFLTTDGPRSLSSPPRRFESQLSFESIGLFSLSFTNIFKWLLCVQTIVPCSTHTQRFLQYLWQFCFVFVCFCIVMFAHEDHLFIQSFDCTAHLQFASRVNINYFKMYLFGLESLNLLFKKQRRWRNWIIFGLDSVSADLSSSHTWFYQKSFYLCTKYTWKLSLSLYCLTHSPYVWFIAFFYANTPIFHLSHATIHGFTAYLFIISGFFFSPLSFVSYFLSFRWRVRT